MTEQTATIETDVTISIKRARPTNANGGRDAARPRIHRVGPRAGQVIAPRTLPARITRTIAPAPDADAIAARDIERAGSLESGLAAATARDERITRRLSALDRIIADKSAARAARAAARTPEYLSPLRPHLPTIRENVWRAMEVRATI